MTKSNYRRVIVKLSGEALSGPEKFGIHQPTIDRFAADLVAAHKLGIGLGVVVGGGNILRGAQISENGLSRPTADSMGMLATVMNALVLEAAIERAGVSARTMSALAMPQVCETYERQRALRHLEDGRIIVFAGGTGNPYFTTDTTAVLRAAEMGCDAVLKATDVDGVYTADPKTRSERQTLRAARPPGGARPQPENHGCDGVRACPGEPNAYHRFFDPGAGRDRDRLARKRALHHGRLSSRERTKNGRGPCGGRHGNGHIRHERPQAPHAGRDRLAQAGAGGLAHRARLDRRCSTISRSKPTAATCRSISSPPSACRSRGCSACRSGTVPWSTRSRRRFRPPISA